jgi:hypothetical protein
MYCSNCAAPITPSLSFCNRCGANLKQPVESKSTGAISAFLTAVTLIGIAGMGIMLGGTLALRKEAGFPYELIGVFMLFTFLIVCLTEFMLIRNLSKLTGSSETKHYFPTTQQPPLELRPATTGSMGEPVGSVTDNTTRTLEYARRER